MNSTSWTRCSACCSWTLAISGDSIGQLGGGIVKWTPGGGGRFGSKPTGLRFVDSELGN